MGNILFKIAQTDKEKEKCFEIREKVFMDEQKVPAELEWDELDEVSTHFYLTCNDIPVGTVRLAVFDSEIGKIGRMAILKEYRRNGFGKVIMENIINYAKQNKIKKLVLASQSYITEFYEKLGFKVIGDEFLDANIPHFKMILELQ